MASGNNFEAPPSLTRCSSYEAWLKELKIWQSFSDIPKAKQKPALFPTLEGKARESDMELAVDDLNSDNGVKNITACLDRLYLKDKTQTAYEAYDSFERFRRPDDLTISDCINEFERLLNKIKRYGSDMSTDILGYRLLRSANLSEQHQQLARATITELKYDTMKTQLEKIFGGNPDCSVKVETVNECTYEEQQSSDAYYTDKRPSAYRPNFYNSFRARRGQQSHGHFSRGNGASTFMGNRNARGRSFRVHASQPKFGKVGKNPVDSRRNITRCGICDSLNHWAANCPYNTGDEKAVKATYAVNLYQSSLPTEQSLKQLTGASLSAAVLDSRASRTVFGSPG